MKIWNRSGGGGGGGITLPDAVRAVAEVRLDWESVTEIKLVPWNGNRIEINGEVIEVPDAGDICDATSELIDDGGELGGPPLPDTLYYAYRSNTASSFAPGELRLSPDAPAHLIEGAQYLASTGEGPEWRYVGMVYTVDDGGGDANFADDETDRLVLSAFNKVRKSLYTCPGYVNDNAVTSYNQAVSATFALLNGGSGASCRFLSDGSDAVDVVGVFFTDQGSAINSALYPGLAIDLDVKAAHFYGIAASEFRDDTLRWTETPAAGLHSADLMAVVVTNPITVYADLSRNGAAADPAMTYLSGSVWC